MPSAFSHDPAITTPGSSTDNAIVIFDGTGGSGFGNSTILVDSGGNGRIGIAGDTDVIIVTANTVTVAGTVAATTLTGAGAGITALAAANITASGTLPALNGAALTALNGTQVTSGTLPAARIAADSIVEGKLNVSNGPTNGQVLTARDGVAGGFTWEAAAGGPTEATTDDVEDEGTTNANRYVSPEVLHRHPGVAKVRWNGNSNIATMVGHEAYGMGVSGFTDNDVGDHTFTFDTAFSSINFSWFASVGHIAAELHGGITVTQYDVDAHPRTTTTLRIRVAYGHYSPSAEPNHLFNAVDCNELDLIVFGDQ